MRKQRITMKTLEDFVKLRVAISERIKEITRRYFNAKQQPWDELRFDYDFIRAYPEGKIQVQAYWDHAYEDAVEIPSNLLANPRWEEVIDGWIEEEAARQEESRKFRALCFVKDTAEKYIDEVESIVAEVRAKSKKTRDRD